MPHAEWKALVAAAVERIGAGDFEKVVLARRIDITANRPFLVSDVLARLVALYPSCMVFSVDGSSAPARSCWSPAPATEVVSHPLAGTVARSGDAHADEALVAGLHGVAEGATRAPGGRSTCLRGALAPVCDELDVPDRPSVLGLAQRVAPGDPDHRPARRRRRPTDGPRARRPAPPHPRRRRQPDRRPRCATCRRSRASTGAATPGPVGWVDARGDGAWALGIRCAEVDGAQARLFAGDGVVAGSDPADELAETQLKLQALLAALVRP